MNSGVGQSHRIALVIRGRLISSHRLMRSHGVWLADSETASAAPEKVPRAKIR